jgi:hypothetical protein
MEGQMTQQSHDADSNDTGAIDRERSGGDAPPRTPRWVIILGMVALILILAVVAQLLLGIQHGPGMHGS